MNKCSKCKQTIERTMMLKRKEAIKYRCKSCCDISEISNMMKDGYVIHRFAFYEPMTSEFFLRVIAIIRDNHYSHRLLIKTMCGWIQLLYKASLLDDISLFSHLYSYIINDLKSKRVNKKVFDHIKDVLVRSARAFTVNENSFSKGFK